MPSRRAQLALYHIGIVGLGLYSIFRFREAMLTFYMLDDFWVMHDAVEVRLYSLWDVEQFFWPGHMGFRLYRPFTTVAYSYLLQSLFAFDASAQHGFQLLVFALNVLLVAGIVRRLTGSLVAGAAAALMYQLAPGQAVNAYWISAFTVTGTTVWVLAMLWCWLVLRGRLRIAVCTVLQACGLLASEHAIAAPALCAMAAWARRERLRPTAIGLTPSAVLVASYAAAKLLYLRAVPRFNATYSVNFAPSAMLEDLGKYVVACFNVLALQRFEATGSSAIGLTVLAVLIVTLWYGWHGSEGSRWMAAGTVMFVASLIPVLVLKAHHYDHYICTAALGAALAVVGLCRTLSPRQWPALAAAGAIMLLLFELGSGERAWRDNKTFRLVVNGSLNCAAWVRAVQHVVASLERPVVVNVPMNASTRSLFAIGHADEFLPGMPLRVSPYEAGSVIDVRPWEVTVSSAPLIPLGEPMPLWDSRWDWLRAIARWRRIPTPRPGPGPRSRGLGAKPAMGIPSCFASCFSGARKV